MFKRNIPRILVTSILTTVALAQQDSVRGPLSGFVYDGAARAIRPIVGVPGASYLGAPLAVSLEFASISPDGKLALVESQGRLFLLRRLETGRPSWLFLEGAGRAERVAWNAESTAAAVYSSGTTRLRVWTNLGGSPTEARSEEPSPRASERRIRPGTEGMPALTDLGELAGLGGEVSALSLDAQGAVLVGVAGETSGGLYLVSRDREPALLARMVQPSDITLLEDGRDLLVADRWRPEILKIGNYHGEADVSLFAAAGHGVNDPVALAISGEKNAVVVASGTGRQLSWFDLRSGALTASVALDFEPSRLAVSGAEAVYVLNVRSAQAETLHVLAGGREPAVYFVPAGDLGSEPVED